MPISWCTFSALLFPHSYTLTPHTTIIQLVPPSSGHPSYKHPPPHLTHSISFSAVAVNLPASIQGQPLTWQNVRDTGGSGALNQHCSGGLLLVPQRPACPMRSYFTDPHSMCTAILCPVHPTLFDFSTAL